MKKTFCLQSSEILWFGNIRLATRSIEMWNKGQDQWCDLFLPFLALKAIQSWSIFGAVYISKVFLNLLTSLVAQWSNHLPVGTQCPRFGFRWSQKLFGSIDQLLLHSALLILAMHFFKANKIGLNIQVKFSILQSFILKAATFC